MRHADSLPAGGYETDVGGKMKQPGAGTARVVGPDPAIPPKLNIFTSVISASLVLSPRIFGDVSFLRSHFHCLHCLCSGRAEYLSWSDPHLLPPTVRRIRKV